MVSQFEKRIKGIIEKDSLEEIKDELKKLRSELSPEIGEIMSVKQIFEDGDKPISKISGMQIQSCGRADTCVDCGKPAYWKYSGKFGDLSFCEDCLRKIISLNIEHYVDVIADDFDYLVLYQILELSEGDELHDKIMERFEEVNGKEA